MANAETNAIKIAALENTLSQLLANAVNYENGIAIQYENSGVQIGDLVYGSGNPNINTGGFFFAKVTSIPVTSNSDLDFEAEF